jgi:hypothetical protein
MFKSGVSYRRTGDGAMAKGFAGLKEGGMGSCDWRLVAYHGVVYDLPSSKILFTAFWMII